MLLAALTLALPVALPVASAPPPALPDADMPAPPMIWALILSRIAKSLVCAGKATRSKA